MSGRPLLLTGGVVVALVLGANMLYTPHENTWLAAEHDHGPAAAPHVAHDLPLPQLAQLDAAAECALRWRPGLVPRIAPSAQTAWLGATGEQRARLDRFFAKLLRGEKVSVYFLGESVTRGSGADHSCATCRREDGSAAAEVSVHNWINRTLVGGFPPSCAPDDASDPYKRCSRVRGAENCPANANVCFPRNSWRCLMIHWLEHAFPGQIDFRISAKPLLFMASCFGKQLASVDLVVHEYAVNGGGRMLCLQERILRAALMGAKAPAVLELLWLPKHYRPPPPEDIMTQVQAGLRALGEHYGLPTLVMTAAFQRACAPGERWCYARDPTLGGTGFLHADMYHPNADGHAFFAAHILEQLERSLRDVMARKVGVVGGGAPAALPASLHALNRGLDSSAEGGKGLCLPVEDMVARAAANTGWSVVTEVTKANVKRLPALQAERQGAYVEWTLDVRGVLWLIVTYMQSYAGFGTIDLQCVSGCSCALHTQQASADVDGVAADAAGLRSIDGHNYINATNAKAKTSEPQWRILTLHDQSAACVVRVTASSAGKFKLMLLSLIRTGHVDEKQTSTDDAKTALACFGVRDGSSRGHGMIRTGEKLPMDAFTLDETSAYTKNH